MYFSEYGSINCNTFVLRILTRPALLDFLSCNPKNREYLHHYLNDYIHHFRRYRHFGIDFETSEKGFYAFKDVGESKLTFSKIFGRLRNISIRMTYTKGSVEIHTKRRTPNPAKTTFAGEKTYQMK